MNVMINAFILEHVLVIQTKTEEPCFLLILSRYMDAGSESIKLYRELIEMHFKINKKKIDQGTVIFCLLRLSTRRRMWL